MEKRPVVWKLLRWIARFLTKWLFDLKASGLQHVPAHGGALIVSNHQSNLDPIVLGASVDRPLSYMAKEELFRFNPALAWLLRLLGGFPVRQGHGDIQAVRQCIQRLQDGFLLNIYPEGSRTPDGEIGKIEKGVALIERKSHVPIIPAVIVGAFEAWPIHRGYPRPWPVRVRFGPPMNLADLKSDEILATIDRTLRKMYDELRADEAIAANPDVRAEGHEPAQ